MKRTVDISISGISFHIESEAYELLNQYSSSLEETYKNNPDGEEIIADIEARIAELILSWQKTPSTPVTVECVHRIIDQLGLPDELAAESKTQPAPEAEEKHPSSKLSKRFYRNPDGAIIGGVVNGLATYFGIDVTWLRIILVTIAALSIPLQSGQLIAWISVAYVVLLLIVPKAKTPLQKLEMKGEKITVSSLENSLRESMDAVSSHPKNQRSASIFSNLIWILGQIIRAFFIMIAVIVSIVIITAILATLIAATLIIIKNPSVIEFFTSVPPFWAGAIFFTAVLAPLLFILFLLFKMIFNIKKLNRPLLATLIGLWIVSWIAGGFLIGDLSLNNAVRETVRTNVPLPASDTLYVKTAGNPLYPTRNISTWLSGEFVRGARFSFETTTGDPYMEIIRSGKGRDRNDAVQNIERIDLPYRIAGDTVFITPSFVITPSMKIRDQYATVNIYLPEETVLVVDESLGRYAGDISREGKKNMRSEVSFEKKGRGGETFTVTADSTSVTITSKKRGKVTREVITIPIK